MTDIRRATVLAGCQRIMEGCGAGRWEAQVEFAHLNVSIALTDIYDEISFGPEPKLVAD